ncbi:hypothetical protein MSMTP_2302 [Methanosarcina sp. MTP4]|uniref:vWA domain-containing protein n=1 Tax=Methanosarcina sp. MTP4 TaxID=1434100 RepID=UPI000615DB82|nr:hypothetical protein [Methanosarcina sp. MTP4]AKB25771.1 hypothetical protein MSMTP_2302 [Methanosarcina sp. MTP4]
MNVSLEQPEMLLLVIPVILAGFYLLRNTKTKLVEWRMLVAFLLVLALASPVTLMSNVVSEDNPSLIVVSDETGSMGIFQEGTGTDLYEALTAKTPTTFIQLTGDKTSLGDAVLQYSGSGSQVVLVTDGNNNAGKDLTEALEFARETDTRVYMVEPELEVNDLSVQVLGDKTVVVENENEFEILVSQANDGLASYFLKVYVDGELFQSKHFSQDTREMTIPITRAFGTLGAHNLRVEIEPDGEDLNDINNEFDKALYVVPKPKITLVTDEPDSPLGQVLSNLYEVSVVNDYPGADKIEDSKALVLDNRFINTLSEKEVKEIKTYVSDGNGLIVVGGEGAYNYGNYLNSSLEALLPVISKPSEFKGGRSLILVLDVSPSTLKKDVNVAEGISEVEKGTLADILGNAIWIIQNENLKDADVAVVAFGSTGVDVSEGFVYLGLPYNVQLLEEKISQLNPHLESETSLDEGLETAKSLLESEDGELDVIILSDGGIEDSYPESLEIAKELQGMGVNFYFIHIRSSASSQYDSRRNLYAEMLMKEVDGVYQSLDPRVVDNPRATIDFEPTVKPPEEEEDEEEELELDAYPLLVYSPNHFITRNVDGNVTGMITGYNDVTPKAGAERLIITVTGKPVLTTWRFGLGRVAALSTDNGEGSGRLWAPVLYSGKNARLISGMSNWAIGNPRAEEGAVLDGPDTWLGTPAELTLIMYEEGIPKLKLDGEALDLALTGRNIYETTVSPDTPGLHDISGYPLAVNYPLEFRDVGINKEVEPLVLATGGNIYDAREARALLLKDARQNSEREVQEPMSLKMYVLLAALLLYLSEIIVRRIREMRRLRKLQAVQAAKEAAGE